MNHSPAAKNGGRNGIRRWRRAPKQYEETSNIVINNSTSLFWFKLIITMFFSYCCGRQWNRRWQKWRQIAGNFDCHGDAAVRRGAHRPIEHIQGFTGSHLMPPSGKCLRRIAPAAAMVNKFVETTQNTHKTQLLASNYGTFWALVSSENFIPQNRPSTQLIDATSCVKMWNTTL